MVCVREYVCVRDMCLYMFMNTHYTHTTHTLHTHTPTHAHTAHTHTKLAMTYSIVFRWRFHLPIQRQIDN